MRPPRSKSRSKSSAHVTLVLLGAASLAACSGQQDDTLRRDVYASKEDCLKDWGAEPKCEQQVAPATAHPGYGGVYWIGPGYRPGQYGSMGPDQSAGTISSPRPGSHAIGTSHVSRGGFGASGAAHASGGS